MFRRIFFSFSLIALLYSFVYADDWEVIDRVLYKGTTDKPINLAWDAVDNKLLIMIRFTYNNTNSNSVVYNVYDGDELKFSKIINQTIESDANKWMYIGYCSTQNNAIRVISQEPTNAIKLCKGICDTEPIILNEGVFEDEVYVWTFSYLPPNLLRIDYEFYVYDTQRKVKVCLGITSKCTIPITLPRTGFYVAYIRSHLAVSENEITNWATWSKEALVSLVSLRNFRDVRLYVNNHPDMTQEELYDMMVEKGETSEWINSTMQAFSQVNCKPRAWWVYGHVAPPGVIIFE